MQFVYPMLTWGFLLALVPLLIHLINLMRHRRVRWAAMDFLLQSYRKHRKWIWLKQLVLLMLRMAALVLVVGMLAQWITRGQWLDLLGGKATHHYVLLDDSYSMSERAGGTTAFDRALRVVQQIGREAAGQDSRQKFTLLRFSQAAGIRPGENSIGELTQLADLNAERVDARFETLLSEKCGLIDVTQLSLDPVPALGMIKALAGQDPDENRVLYVLSDFRTKEWANPVAIRESLRELHKTGADVQLVRCTTTPQRNLVITDLRPADDTRAAGVPLFMNIAVTNFGDQPERNVPLAIRTEFHRRAALSTGDASELAGQNDEIHIPPIETIAPGETAIKRVQVYFPGAGQHVVEATLTSADAVDTDNRRWCVVEIPEGEAVLVIDGSIQSADSSQAGQAFYLENVFQPGGKANTGIRPDIKVDVAFLRDTSLDELRRYVAIYLVDVPRLDERAVTNLEAYVRDGGGLAIFVGEDLDRKFYNERLYQEGAGILPLPLGGDALLAPDLDEDRPDVVVAEHPVFDTFLGDRNPLIHRVAVEHYIRPREDWNVSPQSTVQLAANLRDQSPLVVEKAFGMGRVVVFLTTIAPTWNNWALDPSFVVVMLKLQAHLAAQQREVDRRLVATSLEVRLDSNQYREDVKYFVPTATPSERAEIERQATRPEASSTVLTSAIGPRETALSGIYDALTTRINGGFESRRYALNVDTSESDLTQVDSQALVTALDPIKPRLIDAELYSGNLIDQSGFNRSLMLLGLLVALLVAEQLLSYTASYHLAQGAIRS